jgi:ubiquinone/menaquinone biosynthesis C-methylase UbiE
MRGSQEVRAYFEGVARQWDRLRQDYYGAEVIEKALNAAGLSPSVTGNEAEKNEQGQGPQAALLVDVGCGTGFLTAGIAPYAQKVIGIDDSGGMLEVARENMQKLGLDNIELREGRVSALPVGDGQAEAVFANMVLHHAPDPAQMLGEMARVARQGGRVVITDLDRHDHEWFRVEMADRWLGFTREELHSYMEGAGLSNIKFGWVGTQ